MSHFYPWEAKTKVRRKLRKRRSPNPNQNPAASAKGSPQPRPSKRGNGCHALSVAFTERKKALLVRGGPFCVPPSASRESHIRTDKVLVSKKPARLPSSA